MFRHGVVRVFVSFCVLVFCTGHFVMALLNLTNLLCLQHSFFEQLFNLYYKKTYPIKRYIVTLKTPTPGSIDCKAVLVVKQY